MRSESILLCATSVLLVRGSSTSTSSPAPFQGVVGSAENNSHALGSSPYSPNIASDTNRSITLPCNITYAGVIRTVTWYKDGRVLNISQDARFSGGVAGNPSLTIHSFKVTDKGSYTCSVTRVDTTGEVTTAKMKSFAMSKEYKRRRSLELWVNINAIAVSLMTLTVVGFLLLLFCVTRRGNAATRHSLDCTDLRFSSMVARMIEGEEEKKRGGSRKRSSISSGSSRRERKGRGSGNELETATLDVRRLGQASMDKALHANCRAVTARQHLARRRCQDLIPLMDAGSVKITLLSLARNLPLHLLPHLGMALPVNANRVVTDPPPEWCLCGHCLADPAKPDPHPHPCPSSCCGLQDCVTRSPAFVDLCMKPHVLEVVGVLGHHDRLGSRHALVTPQALRNQAKKFFVLWQWGYSGHGGIHQIPSCVEARIRWAYPDQLLEGDTFSDGGLAASNHSV